MPALSRSIGSTVVVAALLAAPALASSQTAPPQDLTGMSMEDLLSVEVVSTASKFPQAVREAPAAITILTADDIRRQGFRTLSDALRSVRGFYTTYDRNYSYVGVRGFSRPGDYNTRVLLLIDGHKLNDGIYDMAPIGTDFPVDISLIDRIEVIRGPGSALYGTSAMFGVINVITKSGARREGTRVEAAGGTLDTAALSASYGASFGDGREFLLAGSGYRSGGQHRIHYPEFDTGDAQAIAVGLDTDEATRAFASMSAGRFSVRAAAVHRRKRIPTASFETLFGDDRERTIDDRAYVSAVYDGAIGKGWTATGRAAYDYSGYRGYYPYDYGEDGIFEFIDSADSQVVSGEFTARRRLGARHLFTTGVEVRSELRGEQIAHDLGESMSITEPGTSVGIYAQDEVRAASWLLISGGLRLDRFSSYGSRVTPRVAVVLLPDTKTAIKLLHGRAFRAPNPYERYYYNLALGLDQDLAPEHIRSSEVVVERTLSRHVRASVSAFHYDIDRIIEQRSTRVAGVDDLFYANAGRIHGQGVEVEAEARLDGGIVARASHAFVRVRDVALDATMTNSPAHLSKIGVQVPISRLTLGFDGQFVGERLTLDGSVLPAFFAPNLTVGTPDRQGLSFSLSVFNVFNQAYSDPGAEEHVQTAIRQDGRSALLRVTFGF